MRPFLFALFAAGVVAGAAPVARAGVIPVFTGDPSWTSSGNQNGGSSAITATTLLDGNGAVAINGDRTRFGISNANYGLLSNLSAFNFQWAVTQVANMNTGGGGPVATAQAPALRLFTFDPATGRQIQFIWEDGEQSSPAFVNGAGTLNTTYTGDFFGSANRVYPFTAVSGLGRGLFDSSGNLIPGSDSAQPIGNLISTLNSPNAFVFSFGVGVGSSAGNFKGFADQVTIGFGGSEPLTYDFRAGAADPIPEPATLAALGALAACGFGYSRRSWKAAVPA